MGMVTIQVLLEQGPSRTACSAGNLRQSRTSIVTLAIVRVLLAIIVSPAAIGICRQHTRRQRAALLWLHGCAHNRQEACLVAWRQGRRFQIWWKSRTAWRRMHA